MDLLARITALVAPLAPALGLELLARFFAGVVHDRFQKSMQQAGALSDLAARRALIIRHMTAHHMLLCIAERLAVLSLWMRAQARCGRVSLRFHLDIPEMTISPPPGAIHARLTHLTRRLDSIDADADALVKRWHANGPLRLAAAPRSTSPGEAGGGKISPPLSSPMRSVGAVDHALLRVRRRGPAALTTGPPVSLHPENQNPRLSGHHRRERGRLCCRAPHDSIRGHVEGETQ